jgi:hypothetical protein
MMNTQLTPALQDRWVVPTAGKIQEIATREGIDAATTQLYQSVFESSQHGAFIRRVDAISTRIRPRKWQAEAALIIVPGAFYRENPRSGADGRLLREQAERLDCPTGIIPIASRGTLKQNARIICDWLVEHQKRPVILASLSKGGADVKMALAEPDAADAFKNVAAWVNLCGILNGTPMAEWLLSRNPAALLNRLYYTLRGQGLGFLRDLVYGSGRPLDCALQLPHRIHMVTIAGFPLQEHLSSALARRCHRRLTYLGPNDGSLVLSDVCALPGMLYPIWGADHYLRPQTDVNQLVLSVLQYLDEELQWRLCPQS